MKSTDDRAHTGDDVTVGSWDLDARSAALILAAITGIALVLRLLGINSDLWLDEVAPVNQYRTLSALGVITTYTSANNHLMNTLLVKFTTSLAGESEWSVRLPAVLFGVATIPAMYRMVRLAASRAESLCACLLLAVSYHHVFFTQNARGYSAYLFFSLLATGMLVRGLERDGRRTWVAYVVCMFLDLASLLHGFFVFAGHMIVAGGWTASNARRRRPAHPPLARLVTVFAITGLLGVGLYAAMAVQAVGTLRTTYTSAGAGMPVTSQAFRADFVRGLVEGFGPLLVIAAPFAIAVVGYGFLVLLRRKWTLALSLVAPLLLVLSLVLMKNLSASPRFFLLGLPTAFISLVLGIFGVTNRVVHWVGWGARSRRSVAVAGAVVSVGALASIATLRSYYATPKQSYRAAVSYLKETRRPGDLVVLIQNAEEGFRFYGTRAGLVEGKDFVALRTPDSLETIRALGRPLVLVTTLERSLVDAPELQRRMEVGWKPVRTFPATIHDGEIRVWQPRTAP